MKSRNRKRCKPRRSARRQERSVTAKARETLPKKKADPAAQPWLRILSHDIELDTNADRSAGVFALVNGRRRVQDQDFHRAEAGTPLRGSRKNIRTLDFTANA